MSAFRCIMKGFGLEVFYYLSESLPLKKKKLCYFRGSRFAQCFILSTALIFSLPSKHYHANTFEYYKTCPVLVIRGDGLEGWGRGGLPWWDEWEDDLPEECYKMKKVVHLGWGDLIALFILVSSYSHCTDERKNYNHLETVSYIISHWCNHEPNSIF